MSDSVVCFIEALKSEILPFFGLNESDILINITDVPSPIELNTRESLWCQCGNFKCEYRSGEIFFSREWLNKALEMKCPSVVRCVFVYFVHGRHTFLTKGEILDPLPKTKLAQAIIMSLLLLSGIANQPYFHL